MLHSGTFQCRGNMPSLMALKTRSGSSLGGTSDQLFFAAEESTFLPLYFPIHQSDHRALGMDALHRRWSFHLMYESGTWCCFLFWDDGGACLGTCFVGKRHITCLGVPNSSIYDCSCNNFQLGVCYEVKPILWYIDVFPYSKWEFQSNFYIFKLVAPKIFFFWVCAWSTSTSFPHSYSEEVDQINRRNIVQCLHCDCPCPLSTSTVLWKDTF